MSDVKISVIIPIYNVVQYLEKCISSIIGQTYKKLQIILVDDGSTDESASVCDEFSKLDERIVVVHKPNGGLVSARKAGLQIATGEYVGYVDGDDWIEPDMYEQMLAEMLKYQVDMVEIQHYIEANAEKRISRSKLLSGKYDVVDVIPEMLCDDCFNECRLLPYVWSKLFKRELLIKNQILVDERIRCGEDIAVVYPYVLDCTSIYISKYVGYHYVQHTNSMTSVVHEKEWVQNQLLIQHLHGIFKKNVRYGEVMLKQLNQYAKCMALVRNMEIFDILCGENVIKPFSFIDNKKKVALYGAGRMGKEMYRYLQDKDMMVTLWADKEYKLYQQLGMDVVSPEELAVKKEEYDAVVICVCSRTTAEAMQDSLHVQGIDKEKMVWLSESFVSQEYNVVKYFI